MNHLILDHVSQVPPRANFQCPKPPCIYVILPGFEAQTSLNFKI